MILPIKPTAGLRPDPSNWAKEPEKATTTCFYCHHLVPDHAEDCVCRERTVVLEFRIKFVACVPASWDQAMIEFHRNESSYCSSNDIRQLYEESEQDPGRCTTCQRSEVLFIREATIKDHQNMHWMGKQSD